MAFEMPFSVNVGTEERVASIVGGVLLTAYGIKRSSLAGLGMAATGTVLVFRGVTGHCPANAAVGRNTAVPRISSRRRVDIRTSLTVDRPREEVYAYWRQLENLPNFMKHLDEVREVSARRSQWAASVPNMDARIEWEAKIQ